MSRRTMLALTGLLAALAMGLSFASDRLSRPAAGETALFSSLPLLLPESADPGGLPGLRDDPPWVRAVLEARGPVRPLDVLAPMPAGPDLLVMAQPRPLSPDENVALDAWVRAGGRVLLLADPALTFESVFALGDPRRPQDTVLLSPILRRWGLILTLDDHEAGGERMADLGAVSVPVNLAGRLRLAGPDSPCATLADGLAATCPVGRGRVLVLADAAVLESPDEPARLAARRRALIQLMRIALED